MEGRSDCPGDSGWLAGVLDVVVALCVWAETAVGVLYMNVYVCVRACVAEHRKREKVELTHKSYKN